MGWIIGAVMDCFWIMFVESMSQGKPWWVWVLWLLSPLFVLAALFGAGWLLLG